MDRTFDLVKIEGYPMQKSGWAALRIDRGGSYLDVRIESHVPIAGVNAPDAAGANTLRRSTAEVGRDLGRIGRVIGVDGQRRIMRVGQ